MSLPPAPSSAAIIKPRSRTKFYSGTLGSTSDKRPSVINAGRRTYYIDGLLFAQSQATSSLHFAADAAALSQPLCAKIYAATNEAEVAANREVAAERSISQALCGDDGRERHPSTIIRFLADARFDNGQRIIVMPFFHFSLADVISSFLEPRNLDVAVGAPPPLLVRLLAMTALGVAAALDKLHEVVGIAHCDVKPSNIMMRTDGVPVLVDLAAATKLGKKPVETSPQWVPCEPAGPSMDDLVATASRALDLRCLAASVFSVLFADSSSSLVKMMPYYPWSVATNPAAPVAQLCWDAARQPEATAAALVEAMLVRIRADKLLAEGDIEACLR